MKTLILRGLPGSGKSYFLREIFRPVVGDFIHCSADHFFETESNYNFDHSKIGEAHRACFAKFREARISAENKKIEYVVIDNTNSQRWEMAPYIAETAYHGDEHHILEFLCDEKTSFERNVHSVPESVIVNMKKRWEKPLSSWRHSFYNQDWKSVL